MNKIKFYLKETAKEWAGHNPLLLGAAISFYIVLASGPILTLLIYVMGTVFGDQAAAGKFVNEIKNTAGDQAAGMIESIIKKASSSKSNLKTLITSIPLMLFGSTMVFFQVKNALDTLWDGNIKSDTGVKKKLKGYLLSVIMLFVTGAFFFLLMSKTLIISSGNDFFANIFSENPLLSQTANILITLLLVTIFFALVYKLLIKAEIKWRHIFTGAAVTAVLFSLVQIIIGINFNVSNIESAYGAIGSITIWILWIFYSSLIFLFGASFLKVYTREKTNTN